MIQDQAELRRLAEEAFAAGRIALDTEFMGEGRYRTLLCLIQVAVPLPQDSTPAPSAGSHGANDSSLRAGGGDQAGQARSQRIDLIDPLTSDLDHSPLAEVLADPQVTVVVHAGRQDVALLRRALSTEVTSVFDTQLAAGFTGLAAQRSYDSLLSDLLGVKLAKSASFTRWDSRPLTDEQTSYAREDVVHLLALAEQLEARLQRLGRLQWALQECEAIAAASDERDLHSVFLKLPKIASASAAVQAVALELVQWREQTANRQNRPVQSVLSDAALVEIARRTPDSLSDLQRIRGVPQSLARRTGEQIIEHVRRGRRRTDLPPRSAPRSKLPEPSDAPLVALVEALARSRAREAGLAYELIATKSDLQAIVAARRAGEPEPEVRVLAGWRRDLLGEELLRLLDGELSLSVAGGTLLVTEEEPANVGG